MMKISMNATLKLTLGFLGDTWIVEDAPRGQGSAKRLHAVNQQILAQHLLEHEDNTQVPQRRGIDETQDEAGTRVSHLRSGSGPFSRTTQPSVVSERKPQYRSFFGRCGYTEGR